jgi:hypothetical protein
MMAKKSVKRGQEGFVRVDLMDHHHRDWQHVLASLKRRGVGEKLMLRDGYLSARQSLLVARAGKKVVGHLCFHGCVEARLDALDVQPGFGKREVSDLLIFAAQKRASMLRCARVVGLRNTPHA